ncbi:MAG: HdeD family acid-resistance protein [Gulosibacter sp.]|uniref:HdeD family acid-resistance protein n=1 Tax=Gulosibacter sp. TaxID=2817531 RepID=UPI003F9094C0
MSTETSPQIPKGARAALGLGGLLAAIVGVLILVWPGKTAMVVAIIFGIYAVIMGLVYIGLGVRAGDRGWLSRIGHLLLGVLFLVAGAVALLNLGATTVWLALMLGIVIGTMWIFEGIVAFLTLKGAESKLWTGIFAALSIIAGVMLVLSPFYIVALWWMLGISFVVLGIAQIVRAIQLGRN